MENSDNREPTESGSDSLLIHCPIKGPQSFTPCEEDEVTPLVEFLYQNESVDDAKTFPRGTMLPDGRLDLCKQNLGPSGCQRVTEALYDNHFVRSLLLGTDGIGDEGAKAVADLIKANESLEIVYLGCNGISAAGVTQLADGLETNSSVQGLWLKRNPIGKAGAVAAARIVRQSKTLRVLDLVNTKIGSEGLEEVIDALLLQDCSIERLYLGGNGFDAADAQLFANLIRKNQTLKALMLSVNHFADAGAIEIANALSQNTTLQNLGLASNSIGPDGIAAVADATRNHPQLRHLDLGYAPSTKVLGASANRLGDAGSDAIAGLLRQNNVLQRISLAKTDMSPEQTQLICNAVLQNNSLIDLTMDGRRSDQVREHLDANRKSIEADPKPMDVQLIRSVYRTARPS